MLKIPRFFYFERVGGNSTDFHTTEIMDNTDYTTLSAYWDDIIITGFLPILVLVYLNLQIYFKVSRSSILALVKTVISRKTLLKLSISLFYIICVTIFLELQNTMLE